jgi:hypothetical protein
MVRVGVAVLFLHKQMHRDLCSLFLPLSPSSPSLFFFREQLLLRIAFLKITAPSPRSSPQGATVQRALRQLLHALQVPSTGCFDYTPLLCPPRLLLMSCIVPLPLPPFVPTLLSHVLTRIVLCFVIGFSSPQGASSCTANSCTPTQVSNSDFATAGSITGVTGDVSN